MLNLTRTMKSFLHGASAAAAALLAASVVMATASGDTQKPAPPQRKVVVDENGTTHLPAFDVPMSSFVSREAKDKFIAKRLYPPLDRTGGLAKHRDLLDRMFYAPRIQRAKTLWPVHIEAKTMGGVYTEVITPQAGVPQKNQHRVLINLHGGAFEIGARTGGQLESIPIAGIGQIKVVAVDFRQGPEHRFPAASEDVAIVYKELLKQYQPQNIGIYGCSSGGILAAQVVAWFQQHDLPRPGAIGIFCASAGVDSGGDAWYVAPALNGEDPPPLPPSGQSNIPGAQLMVYLAGADSRNPLVAPVHSPAVLAKFPATLVITSTRDMALGSAVHTHTQLVKAGVDARLHVWEGLEHAFFLDVDLPESKEVFDVTVRFFDQQLGR